MRALWVGLKSTVRCAIGRADQAPISAIDAWQLPSPGSRPRPGASRSQAESRPPNLNSGARYHEHFPLITDHA
jgi:hypothetical protein